VLGLGFALGLGIRVSIKVRVIRVLALFSRLMSLVLCLFVSPCP
jgi:hypothetical protein